MEKYSSEEGDFFSHTTRNCTENVQILFLFRRGVNLRPQRAEASELTLIASLIEIAKICQYTQPSVGTFTACTGEVWSLLQCVLQYPGYFRIFMRTFRNDRKFRILLRNVIKKKETSGVFCVCVCSFNIEGSVLFRGIQNLCYKALFKAIVSSDGLA